MTPMKRYNRVDFLARSRTALHGALYERGMRAEDLVELGFSKQMIVKARAGVTTLSEQARYAVSLKSEDGLAFSQTYARKLWGMDDPKA